MVELNTNVLITKGCTCVRRRMEFYNYFSGSFLTELFPDAKVRQDFFDLQVVT
ncbi:MAG: hypothetical protein K1W34_18185 [Lachnospiraceae bacterium]